MTKKIAKNNKSPEDLLSNRWWRLTHLYHIQDKFGNKILFQPNSIQRQLYQNFHYLNIILKARQLGISTFISMILLDICLFSDHQACGIIAHTKEDAEKLFKKIKFAYDYLPPTLKSLIPATNDSARELVFSNGSSIRVGTSMRGSTLQYLHISEFGKICKKYPDKAQEIITGSLNTLAPGQYVFIESTAEGRSGYFYDLCKEAQANCDLKKELSPLEFKFHFFPWYLDSTYQVGSVPNYTQDHLDYFASLQVRGIILSDYQKNWYVSKSMHQYEDMKREYPSTPDEAWEVANLGTYYGKQMTLARQEGRIGFVPYSPVLPVHTAWDLGMRDFTSIWFFQLYKKEILLIEYMEASETPLFKWIQILRSKEYCYGYHIAPHDIQKTEYSHGTNPLEEARMLNFQFIPLEKSNVASAIDNVRAHLARCIFDEKKCAAGISCLDNYRKEWDDRLGIWKTGPLHDKYSHGADAFRYLIQSLPIIENSNHFTGTEFKKFDGNEFASSSPKFESVFQSRMPRR